MKKILNYEISDTCKECIKRHIKEKGAFKIKCTPIPKVLDNFENPYYPLEKVIQKEIYDSMDDKLKAEMQLSKNKLLWAKQVLGWSTWNPIRKFDQFYQRQMLLCSSKLKVIRCGRRMGKSEFVIVDMLHFALTNKDKKVMYVGPFQNLVDEIFDRLDDLLSNDKSIFKGQFKHTRAPYHQIKLPNGSVIKGFTTGESANSIRGQSADRIYLDEAAYIPELAYTTLMAFLLDNPDVNMIAVSTPIAIEGNFKKWCLKDSKWKDFHFPGTILPDFEEQKEVLQSTYTQEGFKLEILAEFTESNANVFKEKDIRNSLQKYTYINSREELEKPNEWIISIGVDYNEYKNGVQIVVLGFNKYEKQGKPFKILNRISIHTNSNNTEIKDIQSTAVQKIIDLYNSFQANYIYCDEGHGSMQNEILAKYFYQRGLFDVFKGINFAKRYEYKDYYTQENKSKRLKVMMVNFLQKRFELNEIDMSSIEEKEESHSLYDQLIGYRIKKFDSREDPVFTGEDHILDGLMLANFAIVENNSNLFEPSTGNLIGVISRPVEKITQSRTNEFMQPTAVQNNRPNVIDNFLGQTSNVLVIPKRKNIFKGDLFDDFWA